MAFLEARYPLYLLLRYIDNKDREGAKSGLQTNARKKKKKKAQWWFASGKGILYISTSIHLRLRIIFSIKLFKRAVRIKLNVGHFKKKLRTMGTVSR